MIITMMNLDPIKSSLLLVIIEKDNFERMQKADPITLESINDGGLLQPPKYPEKFNIIFAYEQDDAELYRRARAGDVAGLIRWLQRGRKWIEKMDGKKNAFHFGERHETDETTP